MLSFVNISEGELSVTKDGADYGKLIWDNDQAVWVLWPVAIDDGVSYFDNLDETVEAIIDEEATFASENA